MDRYSKRHKVRRGPCNHRFYKQTHYEFLSNLPQGVWEPRYVSKSEKVVIVKPYSV